MIAIAGIIAAEPGAALQLGDVAELVDALRSGRSEHCSWRFKSSHPHQ